MQPRTKLKPGSIVRGAPTCLTSETEPDVILSVAAELTEGGGLTIRIATRDATATERRAWDRWGVVPELVQETPE